MPKTTFSAITKSIGLAINRHTPEILTGIGIAGMFTATGMSIKATPKALILIDEKKKEMGVDKLSPVELVKTVWKCYIPAAITSVLSTVCLIGANSENLRRNAALATAYSISENALKEYQEKTVAEIGEKKEQAIRDAIAKDKIDQNPVTTREVIITEKGNTLCFDSISGRYFKSDIDMIKKAVNELNRMMIGDTYVSLNDFYDEIGLKSTKQGDDLGWSVYNELIDLDFSSQLADDGTPCLVIEYRVAPRYDYKKL